eukprot:6174796-Pleurochrysis_carterae.AAC.1
MLAVDKCIRARAEHVWLENAHCAHLAARDNAQNARTSRMHITMDTRVRNCCVSSRKRTGNALASTRPVRNAVVSRTHARQATQPRLTSHTFSQ